MRPQASFDATQNRRRLSGWRATRSNLNTLLRDQGNVLRERASDLVRNHPYMRSARRAWTASLIGDGIVPIWTRVQPPKLRQAMQTAFLRWTDEADADGVTDFYGLQTMIGDSLFTDGEILFRRRDRRPIDGLSVPMQLQAIPAAQLPLDKNETLASGNTIRCGIEFDQIGRRQAYHFLKAHPGDATAPLSAISGLTTRVPAEEVIHVFIAEEPGQIRGVSAAVAAAVRMFMLDIYEDAEIARKQAAALIAGFVTSPADEESLGAEDDPDDDVAMLAQWQAGTMMKLRPGEQVQFSTPADLGQQYEAFLRQNLRAAFASMSVAYSAGSGDYSTANYSSERAQQLELRRRISPVQHQVVAYQFCRRVAQWWVSAAQLSGALKLPRYTTNQWAYETPEWRPHPWPWVDPLKDVEAEVAEIDAGLKSRTRAAADRGAMVEDIDDENAADLEREKDLGLAYGPRGKAKTEAPAKPAAPMPQEQAA